MRHCSRRGHRFVAHREVVCRRAVVSHVSRNAQPMQHRDLNALFADCSNRAWISRGLRTRVRDRVRPQVPCDVKDSVRQTRFRRGRPRSPPRNTSCTRSRYDESTPSQPSLMSDEVTSINEIGAPHCEMADSASEDTRVVVSRRGGRRR